MSLILLTITPERRGTILVSVLVLFQRCLTRMADMQEKYDELEPVAAQRIADTLKGQQREAFGNLAEYDKRITTHNFVTNGGGAVACLTYLGTGADAPHIKVALVLFTLGVIAVGIELRAMLSSWASLTSDAGRRHRGFLTNQITVAEASKSAPDNERARNINHVAGWVSQIAFVVGVVVGGVGLAAW